MFFDSGRFNCETVVMKRRRWDSSLIRDPRPPTNARRPRGSFLTLSPRFSRPKSSKWRTSTRSRTATAPITRARGQGHFLRSGKRRADQPIHASTSRMLRRERLWSNPSEVQDLIYLLLDEWRDGNFRDGKPVNAIVWDKIAANLSIRDISTTQVVNKVHSLRADYKAFCTLKKQTSVGWNHEANTVNAPDAWWDRFLSICKGAKKFKKQGLANFPELNLLFAESTTIGLNAYSSGQGGETEEKVAQVESQNCYRHGPINRVTEEHIASGGVWTDSDGLASINTQSGSRKQGSPSIGGQGKGKAHRSSEELFFGHGVKWIESKNQCHGVSSQFNPTFQTCIDVLEKVDPPLTNEQYGIVFGHLSGHVDNQTGFLSMPPARRNWWAWSCK